MNCIILAGGLATRMKPLTADTPKALLLADGKPFLHYQLTQLAQQGVTDVVLSIGFRGDLIRDYAGDGSRWGLRVRYVDEGTNLRGTGGALRLVLDEGLMAERFFVLYGDSYLPIDFKAVWRAADAAGKPALMTVLKNEGKWDTSNVAIRSDGAVRYDKQRRGAELSYTHIDYGLSVLTRDFVEAAIPRGVKMDLADPLHALSEKGELAAFTVTQRFYEIGSPQGLKEFEAYITGRSP